MNSEQYLEHDWFPHPLPPNVVVGERSWLYSAFAFLHYQSKRPCGVRIGHDCGLYNGTFFDLGPSGEVEIGSYSTLVGAIISSNHRIVIGNYVFISHEVVLADSITAAPTPIASRGDDTLMDTDMDTDVVSGKTSIMLGENSWVGARAILLSGAIIGEGAIIGAATLVDFEVPPYAIVAGNPARIVGWTQDEKVL